MIMNYDELMIVDHDDKDVNDYEYKIMKMIMMIVMIILRLRGAVFHQC